MQYLIIGNSAAAVGAVEGIREIDEDGAICMIASEAHHTYSRPLISYLLQGKTDRQRMKYRPDDFYESNKVDTCFNQLVRCIDPAEKTVMLEDGAKLSYDKLLVATGASPFVPPMKGLENVESRFCFMSLDDASSLEKALFPEAKVLIVGAGLIGLKCAEGMAQRVGRITVVDLAPRILSSILDDDGAAVVRKHLEKQGLEFKLGTSVDEFKDKKAYLKNGEVLDFDILVTAVGVKPNVNLVKDAGGEVGRGIVVDKCMRTSLPDIYSAGDCAESWDISCDSRRILAILPNAYFGGYCAGLTMAGAEAPEQKNFPMNAIGFFGLHIITAGSYEGEVYEENTAGSYKKLFYAGDRLKGFILIGDVDKAGIYTSLIREQTPLSSIDFELVRKKPSLIAFGRKYRDEKLGGKMREN